MKKIRIFIGSSIESDELGFERKSLVSFLTGFNNRFIDRGVYIEPYICEETLGAMNIGGSQSTHDDYIANEADAAFFMFFKKAGEYTLHELQLARQTLRTKKRPDVFIFFKVNGDEPVQNPEISRAVDLVTNTYGHYYKKFSDVDTVKLEMLHFIVDILNDSSEITVNNGTIFLDDTAIFGISPDNIYPCQNNRELTALKSEIKELENRISRSIHLKDWHSLNRYSALCEEKQRAAAQMESDILKMLHQMHRELKKEHADPMRIKALTLLESGRIQEAKALFPLESIQSASKMILEEKTIFSDIVRQHAVSNIENADIRIKALNLDLTNPLRLDEIEKTYDSVAEIIRLSGKLGFLYDFVCFLRKTGKNEKALKYALMLQDMYAEHPYIPDRFDLIELGKSNYEYKKTQALHILGELYDATGQTSNALEAFKSAIEAYSIIRYIKCDLHIIYCYFSLAAIYIRTGKTKEAESCYSKAAKLCESFSEYKKGKADTIQINCYKKLSHFYRSQHQYERAIEYMSHAVKLAESLCADPALYSDIEENAVILAECYDNTAQLHILNRDGKEEEFYQKELDVLDQLVSLNFQKYSSMMADIFFTLGRSNTQQKKQQEGARYYIQALRIMGIYAADFGFDAAKTAEALINLGVYYTKKDQPHGLACNKLAMTLINKYPELRKHYKKFYLKLLEKAADFVETITMDDAEYVAVVEFEYRSQTYVLFCRDDNVFDYLFRKIEYGEDGNEYYTGISSRDEYDNVSAYFESICEDL